jgi:hypothetical protein
MAIRTELHLRLPNSPGALAVVSRLLAGERVDILALMLERGGDLRFVPDNHVRAAAVLREHRHHVVERHVLATDVPHAPGALVPILGLLGDCGVNVEYAYSGVGSRASALVVLGVDDAARAAAAAGL